MLQVRPVNGNHVAYARLVVERHHNMKGFRTHAQYQTTGVWTVVQIDLNQLALHHSLYDLAPPDSTLQESLQRVLVPLNPSG